MNFDNFLKNIKKVCCIITDSFENGKSLKKSFDEDGALCDLHRFEDYFYRPDGHYDFNKKLVKNAKKFLLSQFIHSLEDVVYIILVTDRSFGAFVEQAHKAGYECFLERNGLITAIPKDYEEKQQSKNNENGGEPGESENSGGVLDGGDSDS